MAEGHREVLYTTSEVANPSALAEMQAAGEEVSGERRPDFLADYLETLRSQGTLVRFDGSLVSECSAPESPLRFVRRGYVQVDGIGRAYQVGCGLQRCTRETRTSAFEGMCIAEVDMAATFYQLSPRLLGTLLPAKEVEQDYANMSKYATHSKEWREAVAQYYSIDKVNTKAIFSRLPFGGNANDLLPSPHGFTTCLPQRPGGAVAK